MLAVVCLGAGIALRVEYRAAKDRVDLLDLTSASPWPREELRVPDGLLAGPGRGAARPLAGAGVQGGS